MKISILGVGRVGSTLAYTLALKGLCNELVLVNRSIEKAEGDALDLQHALPFLDRRIAVHAGDLDDTAGSHLIAFCASAPMSREMYSRLDLLAGNARLLRQLLPPALERSPNAIVLMLSNPVDVLTYLCIRWFGVAPERAMGTGTLIDSARFRAMLSAELSIHPEDLRAYILGEHGVHQFPALSTAEVGGEHIEDNPTRRRMFGEAVNAGFQVLQRKGYTNYAIATAAATVVECIAVDTRRTLPLSVLVDGWQGVDDVCLSLPVVVGRTGVLRVLHPELNSEERQAFRGAVAALREAIATVL